MNKDMKTYIEKDIQSLFLSYIFDDTYISKKFISIYTWSWMDKILELEKKAKRIKKLQNTMNTILANGCYSNKEMDNQIDMGNKLGNLDDQEEQTIRKAWAYRNKLARELLNELEAFLDENA